MADQFKVLETVVDLELAAVKRDIMAKAASARMMGGGEHDNTELEFTVRVDLNAVLKCATSTHTSTYVEKEK